MSTARRRRRQREIENVDSSESSDEKLRRKLDRLHGSNALVWARWQQMIGMLGFIVFFYAAFHSYHDVVRHYRNNAHLPFWSNVADCLWQITVHIITAVNALTIRQYIKSYPSPQSKQWLLYLWPISVAECMFILHSFPMGTFYLMLCLGMVYFIDSQQEKFKKTKDEIQKMTKQH